MNKVLHFEIPTEDEKRAKDFYTEVFGWEMNDYPEMNYTIATTGPTNKDGMPQEAGFINGGMMKRDADIMGTVITIGVQSIDESLKKIEDSGGKIVKPKMNVGEMGFAAYFKDPEGNIVGLWQDKKQKE